MHGSRIKLIHGSCFICIIYFFTIAWSYLVQCVFVRVCLCLCVCVFVRLFCVVYVCLCQHVFVITEGHGLSPTCRWLAFTWELLFWGSTKPTHPTGLITVFICFSQKKYSIHNSYIQLYNLPYIAIHIYICNIMRLYWDMYVYTC